MKLVVGLGNIGNQYSNTRHNLGFLVIEEITKRHNLVFKHEASASYATTKISGEKVIFAKPSLFMNNSGKVIRGMMDYFKIDLIDLIVFQDDKDQEMAKLKIINTGGHGGQNGIKDTILHLGTNNFLRVKGGIGSDSKIDTSSYVLGKWTPEQRKELPFFVNKMADVFDDFMVMDFLELANKYNGNA